MANCVDPDQTAPIRAVCSVPTLFASILNSSVMLDNYLQQTTSADNIFRCIFFLGALRVSVFLSHKVMCYDVDLLSSDKRHNLTAKSTDDKNEILLNRLRIKIKTPK